MSTTPSDPALPSTVDIGVEDWTDRDKFRGCIKEGLINGTSRT